jgi:hypothetical protein
MFVIIKQIKKKKQIMLLNLNNATAEEMPLVYPRPPIFQRSPHLRSKPEQAEKVIFFQQT